MTPPVNPAAPLGSAPATVPTATASAPPDTAPTAERGCRTRIRRGTTARDHVLRRRTAPSRTASLALPAAARTSTGPQCAENAPAYPALLGEPTLRVTDPGALIAAIPAMLGFVPEQSLVVALLAPISGRSPGAAMIDAVVRLDLDGAVRPSVQRRLASCVAGICARAGADEVLLVLVDESDRVTPGLLTALTGRLGRVGIAAGAAWQVPSIRAAAPYRSLLGPRCRGSLPDPESSPVAVAGVLDGRPIRPNRSALVDLVAADPGTVAAVASYSTAASSEYHRARAGAVRAGDLPGFHRRSIEWVLGQIADTESGVPREAPELARLGAMLGDRTVRDVLLGLASGDHADQAEQLWAQLVRAHAGPGRADPAALLAFSAYVRGDGPFAGVVLDAALEADPDHALTRLLEAALHTGMRPETLRPVATSGRALGAALGLSFGPERL